MNFLSAFVDIKVDSSKLPEQLAKANKAVTKMVNRIKKSFSRMGAHFKAVFTKMVRYAKWGSLAIAGAFALVIRAAMKQQDVAKRLEITLKATGHAAGFTKKQLLEQASALQKVTRFGDETITAMQTMLLTFKNIKGDEFVRATEAALDMAVAEASVSGRAVDLTAVSIRLGKALNDPILGLTALARVGVDFTEVQKSMIKEMVMAGDVAGAQAVILRELEGEFGGMARDVDTASGALKQMWNALGDVAEIIGDAFLPGIKDTARAVKEWAERNEERIGRFAETAVAHITYFKDVLWVFVKFLQEDWRAGTKVGLDISIELFKGFGESLVILMGWIGKKAGVAFGEALFDVITKYTMGGEIGRKLGLAKLPGLKQYFAGIEAVREKMVASVGKQLGETDIEPLAPRLGKVWENVSASIKDIIPPDLAEEFEEPLRKLEERLKQVGVVAEDIEDPMNRVLVDIPAKSSRAMEEAQGKLKQWASDAKDIWGNLADVAVSALDGMSDALTDLVLTGKADFASLADSILSDLTKIMVKALMVQALGAFMPGLFGGVGVGAGGGGGGGGVGTTFANPMAVMGAPGLQGGGEVTKTGLAVVHKGEAFSGVEGKDKQEISLNISVNAIDAAGTYQFLNKNKRAIATMIQGAIGGNHPLRRSKGWK